MAYGTAVISYNAMLIPIMVLAARRLMGTTIGRKVRLQFQSRFDDQLSRLWCETARVSVVDSISMRSSISRPAASSAQIIAWHKDRPAHRLLVWCER
jgi:hypothetical protein